MSKSKGLVDEKITEATGIKKFVWAFGQDCECEERKQKLNKLFPYKTECLIYDEFEYLKSFNFNKATLEPSEQKELLKIYNRVFNQKREMTTCSPCWNEIISNIKKLCEEYGM